MPPATGPGNRWAGLDSYLDEDSYPEAGALLRRHPELLGSACAAELRRREAAAGVRGDAAEGVRLRQHRSFLSRCVRDGLDHVFQPGAADIDPLVVADLRPALNHAAAAERAFDAEGDPGGLDLSVATWRGIIGVPSLAAAHPALRAALANDAGGVMIRRTLVRRVDPEARAEAIAQLRLAVALTPGRSARRPSRLGNLGLALWAAHRGGDGTDLLREGAAVLREAVATSTGAARAYAAANLGLVLDELYRTDGDPEVLTEGIAACQRELQQDRLGDDAAWRLIVHLGNLLRLRAEVRGDPDDLDRAVAALRVGRDHAPAGSFELPRCRVDLAIALLDRNWRSGDRGDLELAEAELAAAFTEIDPGEPDHPGVLGQRGLTRLRRYEVTGALDALEESVRDLVSAYEGTPDGSVDLPSRAANLGSALLARSSVRDGAGDLDRAVELFGAAVDASPSPSPYRAAYLNNLGNARRNRFGRTADPEDLDSGVAALEDAVADRTAVRQNEDTLRANLAQLLLARSIITGSRPDLARAVELVLTVTGGAEDSRVDGPRRWAVLGQALARRHDLTGTVEDRTRAVEAFDRSCRSGAAIDPDTTVRAGRVWGAWAADGRRWPEAADAYGRALAALGAAVRTQALRADQERWLVLAGDLAPAAAFAACAAGSPQEAVRLLETGRGVLVRAALERDRADLGRLDGPARDLAARFRRCADRVTALERRLSAAR